MAQVTLSPGQNQVFANIAVPLGIPQEPIQVTRATAIATTVSYAQVEPGRHGDPGINPKRS